MNSHKEIVLDGELSLNIPMDGEVGTVTKVVEHDLPTYTGETVITPSTTEQVLATAEKVVTRNIVINPIPSNYGLITWNGSTLTVS
jgi:hypothetical protein